MKKIKATNKKSGFTLVEIVVATIIAAFIAVTAVGALRTITTGRKKAQANFDTAGEIRFAARTLHRDLANIYRDQNQTESMLIGSVESSDYGPTARISFYTINNAKARSEKPEGDVYEVEYFLNRQEQKSTLMRRLWPNPNKDDMPAGILNVVAEDIADFMIDYYDGEEWIDEWPETLEKLPEIIRVSLVAERPNKKSAVTHSFMVNFVRWPGRQSGGSNIMDI